MVWWWCSLVAGGDYLGLVIRLGTVIVGCGIFEKERKEEGMGRGGQRRKGECKTDGC